MNTIQNVYCVILYTIVCLGNERLHQLTASKSYSLRVNLEEFSGAHSFAVYSTFDVTNEATGYVLRLGSYQGDAGKINILLLPFLFLLVLLLHVLLLQLLFTTTTLFNLNILFNVNHIQLAFIHLD